MFFDIAIELSVDLLFLRQIGLAIFDRESAP